jgi:dTMP kinase
MFITLEGSEGSGKSSQHALLVEFLKGEGYSVLATREPGGTTIGEQVRDILSDLSNTDMHPRAEILLFQASRAQLVEQVIRPHLESGGVVVCDRYADSTMAYQGYGYELVPLDVLAEIVGFATGGMKPDLTLLLDIDVREGLQRRRGGGEWNRLDAYDIAFYERVRAGYLEMARLEPERWVIIDASGTPEQVQAAMRAVVLERLRRREEV